MKKYIFLLIVGLTFSAAQSQEISDAIVNAGGPVFTGTKADYNKFHDDKSLYTGVYAKGGPTNVDTSGITITNYSSGRKEADVRGVEKKDK